VIISVGLVTTFDFLSVIISVYAIFAIFQLVYPVTGLVADIHYGRYKCVVGSLWAFVIGCCFLPMLLCILMASQYLPFDSRSWSYAILACVLVMIGVPTVICAFLFFSSIAAFNANVIQFGLDQLHDSPTEHLVLYIHWYVILSYTGTILFKSLTSSFPSVFIYLNNGMSFFIGASAIFAVFLCSCFFMLCISLFIGCCKQYSWFLRDTGSRNPYKLVYNVICFARKHSSPIQRSAFTYCEDELPSRLDFGKEKYGGPYTVEQVENVKVFLNILKVLLSLGPLFAIERSMNILQSLFFTHLSRKSFPNIESIFSLYLVPMLLSVILLIFYVTILRPLIFDYVPSILKRIWLGIALLIIPFISFFILDIIGHLDTSHSTECFLTKKYGIFSMNSSDFEPLDTNAMFLFIPNFFHSCGFLIFHIAVFEFICSQSPHSMKGLLIGVFYAIRGVFQLLGALLFMFPFLGWRVSSSFPSCGFVYYLINIIVGLIGILAFTWTAGRYQNRQRDEPDNIYRYAEEYYDKDQDDPGSDYDNYDNLNVQTID
jgi:peptide/histidine transporter 3/4